MIDLLGLINRIESGEHDLLDLRSRRISKSQVIIEECRLKKISILSAPKGFEGDDIVDVLLNGFTLSWYVFNLGPGAKRQVNECVKSFFSFVEINNYKYLEVQGGKDPSVSTSILPPVCFKDWFDFLLANDTSYSVWKKTSEMLKLFTKSLDQKFGKIRKWPVQIRYSWDALKSYTPIKPKHQKMPPLGLYLGIPKERFSNKELLMGLRYGTIWLLLKLYSQRKNFTSNPVIASQLQSLRGQNLVDIRKFFIRYPGCYSYDKVREPRNEKLDELERACWSVVQQDSLLTEWQFYTFSKLRSALESDNPEAVSALDAPVQRLLLARHVNPDGSLRRRAKGYRLDPDWGPLRPYLGTAGCGSHIQTSCWWSTDLLLHTNLEKLLMVWLLASERAQQAGIKKLTFDGLHFSEDERTLQISTTKLRRLAGRSTKKSSDVETMIYRRREPPFEIYRAWLRHEEHLHSSIQNYNPQRLFIPDSASAVTGQITCGISYSVSMLPLEMLAVEGTVWQRTFLQDASASGRKEAQAFIAILRNRLQRRAKSWTCLPTSPIGQSLVVEHERDSNNYNNSPHAESEVMGHNVKTGKNIYKDGFRALEVEEIIEPVKHFAREVGDAKIGLALKVAEEFRKATRKVSLAEIHEIFGIDSPLSDQGKLLAALDDKDKLAISGEIGHEGETLIIQTDMTAALMIGYIDHLQVEIPKLIITSRGDALVRHLARLIYLYQMFDSFHPKLQLQAKQLASELKFPFPPLD